MDIMLDIETLGTEAGAPILQIGAKTFDRQNASEDWLAEHIDLYVDLQSCLDLGLSNITAATLEFWFRQDASIAQQVMFNGASEPIRDQLIELKAWGDRISQNSDVTWWAKGPDFDMVLIETAATLAGLQVPWRYNKKRDVRTLQDVTGCTDDQLEHLPWFREPDHDALADCEQQIDIVRHCLRKIDGGTFNDEIDF